MVTIFTPTYNRKSYLKRLKKSIDHQTSKNFEWIIVDDGSTDETEALVNSWETDYKITYIKQRNQGKHIAYNNGANHASTEWFVCVDSDDLITPDAIEFIEKNISKLAKKYSGIVCPQKSSDNSYEKNWEKIDNQTIDIVDLRDVYGIKESGIVLRVSYLKKYPFPKFNDEHFLPEGWLYQKLIKEGPFLAINHPFYISAYLQNGLTKNIWRLWQNNPIGILNVLKEKYQIVGKYHLYRRLLCRVKITINISSLCMAVNLNFLNEAPSKVLATFLYFPSLYFYKKRYLQNG